MIKHNHSIRKLSTAIKRGFNMAQERGIEQIHDGNLIRVRDEYKPVGMCVLAMAYLGVAGVQKAVCDIVKEDSKPVLKRFNLTGEDYSNIYHLNDEKYMKPLEIAEKLRAEGK